MPYRDKEIDFLFDIVGEVKYFYEFPVVFVTKKDLGDNVFNTLCKLRRLKLDKSSREDIMDAIADFNLQWLQDVVEVEKFKTNIKSCSNEELYEALNYSINALDNRFKYLGRYVDNYIHLLKGETLRDMNYELEIVQAMHMEVKNIVLKKLDWAKNLATECELKCQMEDEAYYLLGWFDKINDRLSILTAKQFERKHSDIAIDLIRPLKEIVLNLSNNTNFLSQISSKQLNILDMTRSHGGCPLEARIISDMINDLADPIKDLSQPSATAAQALVNKKIFLEIKLNNLHKTTLAEIYEHSRSDYDSDDCICYETRIFNHFLPMSQREKLVTDLCYVWDKFFSCPRGRKSMISIMSAASAQEEFKDDLGTFNVDSHGRKIYHIPGDNTLYQQNEENILVPLNDDEGCVYFYDECGRYYLDKTTQERVYKADSSASEYLLGPLSRLIKHKEERDGVTYYYDTYGRYFINPDGKRIYREADSISEYEQDGYGNLVRIESNLNIYDPCVDDAQVSEDSAYLKKTVGPALRQCIASVVMHQPADPIEYLSAQLRIYKDNMILKEEMDKNKSDLLVERNIRALEEQAAAEKAALEHLEDVCSEATELDSNLAFYEGIHVSNESD